MESLLRLNFPIAPMEAELVAQIPTGSEWQYEPKWDGFRCIAFRNRSKITLQSKSGKPLDRYFPEVLSALQKLKVLNFVVDGEIIIAKHGGSDFDQLLQRIHPALSRVKKLSMQHPAQFQIFDFLADEKGVPLLGEPLSKRRERLERFAKRYFLPQSLLRLSPMTTDISVAQDWLEKKHSSSMGS